jgi:serine/threonine protein kinase
MGSRKYSTPVDVWSIGCIMAEMHNGRALFSGSSDADQLECIFKALGTPDETIFPGIVDLPDYKVGASSIPIPLIPLFLCPRIRISYLFAPFLIAATLRAACYIQTVPQARFSG